MLGASVDAGVFMRGVETRRVGLFLIGVAAALLLGVLPKEQPTRKTATSKKSPRLSMEMEDRVEYTNNSPIVWI